MEKAMSVLGKMKERNVFRVGMAYIVAAWVLVQVMDIILQNFAAPDWILQLLVFFCFAGFPFALWLSWTFALTPDGLRKEVHINRSTMDAPNQGKKLDFVIMALLAVVVGLVSFERFMPQAPQLPAAQAVAEPEPEPVPSGPILDNSIAVLPFVNMSADPGQEYFSDGISEELLNVLTQVDGLHVASRTSSFAFKGDSRGIQQIARQLRVANILEGSVRKVGDRLRVTAQLIDADTDVHLWSDSFDREMTDIFQVQDEIANAIVSALTVELGVGLQAVNVATATSNLDAYDLYLRAREMFIARENLPTSWTILERATHLDPAFARAWETLAAVHSVATSWFPEDGMNHESLALAAARRALELDPSLSMPHAVIGMKHQTTGEGYPGAIAHLGQALENDPHNATAWLWRGITYKDMGYLEKALPDFEQCLEIDPAYLNCRQHLAETLLAQGQVQQAVREFETTIPHNFHSASDAFVPYYLRTGQKKMAYLLAALSLRRQFAPVQDWIEAIEHPDEDHGLRIQRFRDWGQPNNFDVCDMGTVPIALKMAECFPVVENARLMWQPDSTWYRKTQSFKDYVNEHLMVYWQEHGFPPQCRALEAGDFECD
jgi:TolB-like protein/lipoprotein NlpI